MTGIEGKMPDIAGRFADGDSKRVLRKRNSFFYTQNWNFIFFNENCNMLL